ncbi:hypothetical protein [Streptomyces candidus]|uniref:Uncharacterized protein n=1 Tax=Streptomyces candidus TaxID=67283 RepID=A0A7X0HN13_9ACTN|nr:hypothetical protein [Streptomyces candidus]MBB6439384.1 hypothetical protein [Streptomyces candidus]GHH54954.1 hypothetical protein GCM10018773_58730 [Streptomyces candidus]
MTATPYTVDDSTLTLALDDAHERLQRAEDRLARIACAHIAAAVRDILTDHDPDAPFDAAHLRLIRQRGTAHVLSTDGTYWTTSGEQRRIEPSDLTDDGLLGWTNQLHEGNRPVWLPLCKHEGPIGEAVGYRLDLTQAAHLPEEANQTARFAEIRARLAAATRAPWSAEEFVYTRDGGLVDADHPEAVHTDFVVTDADDMRVAEIAVNHDGPEDTETPAEDIADSRANAELIAYAPEDLRFLVAHLDHLCGGEDAEALHQRGHCGHCGTTLYTSALSEAPASRDGDTQCEGRRTWLGFPLQHVLRT